MLPWWCYRQRYNFPQSRSQYQQEVQKLMRNLDGGEPLRRLRNNTNLKMLVRHKQEPAFSNSCDTCHPFSILSFLAFQRKQVMSPGHTSHFNLFCPVLKNHHYINVICHTIKLNYYLLRICEFKTYHFKNMTPIFQLIISGRVSIEKS